MMYENCVNNLIIIVNNKNIWMVYVPQERNSLYQ